MQNLLKQTTNIIRKVESRGIVYQLLALISTKSSNKMVLKDNRIEEAIHYIRKHINETIELGVLAEKSGLSKKTILFAYSKRDRRYTFKIYYPQK